MYASFIICTHTYMHTHINTQENIYNTYFIAMNTYNYNI